MKRSRQLFFHEDVNSGKLACLDALAEAYRAYLQLCIDLMISHKRFDVPRFELAQFFPKSSMLNTNIESSCQQHAVGIIKGWSKSRYETKLKQTISRLRREEILTEETSVQLYTIGKKTVDRPSALIEREALDMYWYLLLQAGKTPQVSNRIGMRLNKNTGNLFQVEKNLTSWWLTLATLKKNKTIRIPVKANPHINFASQLVKGALVRQDKKGRWLVEAMETQEVSEPKFNPKAHRVGIDVGLNIVAATSDGRVYGRDAKAKFDKDWYKIKSIRANRQRQGLNENTKRLDVLEGRLSGFVKTLTGTIANKLVKSYENHAFVLEDLNLSGCKGQKRFAYRALTSALGRKAPTLIVNPAYTSQVCPSCGYVSRNNRKGVEFRCRGCGRKSHADVIGAINLLRRSQDKQISLDDDPSEVKAILHRRHRLRRLRPEDRQSNKPRCELTSGVLLQVGTRQGPCIDSNANRQSPELEIVPIEVPQTEEKSLEDVFWRRQDRSVEELIKEVIRKRPTLLN